MAKQKKKHEVTEEEATPRRKRFLSEVKAENALNTAAMKVQDAHEPGECPLGSRKSDQEFLDGVETLSEGLSDLPVTLTAEERLTLAESTAQFVAAVARLTELKKRVASSLGDLIKAYDERIQSYSAAVDSGVMDLPVPTVDLLEGDEVITYRADTCAIVRKRDATDRDKQLTIKAAE